MNPGTGTVTAMPGPVALVGSGEFLVQMCAVDEELLDGRPRVAVFLPTAAAEEGEESVRHWLDLGTSHYEEMGVQAVPLRVLTRADADNPDLAAAVTGADPGLVYLSGGDPGYLADTLRDTAVWRAIRDVWEGGAALAGCSAGACALSAVANRMRGPRRRRRAIGLGLGAIPHLTVIPHFDRMESWAPGIVSFMAEQAPAGTVVVGIDEDTALVGGPVSFVVRGLGSVWVIDRESNRTGYPAGTDLDLPPPAAP